MIIDTLYNLSLQVPDLLIMVLCAIAIGGLGVLIAHAAYSIWWKRHASDRDPSRDAGDGVHNSILALIAFLMALITTSELSSFANADKQITLEGVAIKRLDRDLANLGEMGTEARTILRSYVGHVAGDEWHRLSRRPQSLSPAAEQDLARLWGEVRRLQPIVRTDNPSIAGDIADYTHKIEDARISRLSASVNGIPDVVWVMMGLFFVSACVLAGRHKMSRYARQVVFIQMSALGIILALDIIIDNPFGGDTSLTPDRLVAAVSSKVW